jgi:PPOX class probable F420-dependent enzyme
MAAIPEQYLDLFRKLSFAHVATLMPDGSPQVTPVWIDYDGAYILINTAKGRVKDRNMRRDGRVALSIVDPDDPYRRIQVRGRVADITEAGAKEHIDALAAKYWGNAKPFTHLPGEVRVIFKIAAEQVSGA